MCLLTYSLFWMSLKITILYLQQSECVCVCVCVCVSMRAVYLVLLNLSFLRMSVLYAYCLLSIFKPFISACVCGVCVCDRERDSLNEFSIVNVFYCQPCISHWPTRGLQPCSWRATVLQISSPNPIKHTWTS